MIYIIDTEDWQSEDVEAQCKALNLEFRDGFHYNATCIKLASLLLKREIADHYGIDFSLLSTSSTGKPEFTGTPVHFNISHHKSIAIAVTSVSQPVGVDLTDETTPFTDAECLSLFSQAPPKHSQGIFWAAREAYLKYTGEGCREQPLKTQQPSHNALPDLFNSTAFAVMPLIHVENQYARLFKLHSLVGAVLAPPKDLEDIRIFSSDKS